ncbi:M36 family metallopeptidase [Capillimicrobium parvum]|uniref:F5/8 type C domain-containing protein n=1 Tax=Capillimicrobium parvum TaxID=2884022 RepID=A0A9E7BX29_9ACTN|nr:M36 family metallopeptidase [Capillimicrobium parvum]UGS34021.1 hypothetical protein DSM104329_00391 [Capillimicrobium parvum]
MPTPRVLATTVAAALLVAAPASAAARPDFDAHGSAAGASARTLAAASGALTGPSPGSAADVARSYLRRERASLGLDAADVSSLALARTVALGPDAVNLHFADEQDGVPLFGSDLRVAVADDGRVLSVTGAPAHDAAAPTLTPHVSAADAVAAARSDAGLSGPAGAASEVGGARSETRFGGGTTAKLVRFPWGDASIVAWRVLLRDDDAGALSDYVLDGRWATVLYRHSLVDSAATGFTFPAWPGNAVGGTQADEDFTPWLTDSTRLLGNNTHVWPDIDADESPGPLEEVPPSSGSDYHYPLTPVASPGHACLTGVGCTWDSRVPDSWRTNLAQDATQVFSFVNRMHDWLMQPSIGFTEAAGNFQTVNFTGQGKGGDAVLGKASYGADTDDGLPAGRYQNNANMGTPPDGSAPTMRMYMWTDPPYADVHGGVDPAIVLHEYTHGLSNRLVIDADGISTLVGAQPGAMGEGWSDWYALDYIVAHGYETDDPAQPGSLAGAPVLTMLRSQPADCPVGVSDPRCPGTATAGPGGYTYGDFGKLAPRGPEVHDDGEIWTETLWDLRTRLEADLGAANGAQRARSLVTRAMQLSSPYPSFLDMRNAILRADASFFGGADTDAIWEVFAARGMGFFASAANAIDTTPIEDFSLPPASTGTLSGRVTAAGEAAAGVTVTVDAGASTVTGADGRYSLELPAGTYPRVTFGPTNGVDGLTVRSVAVPAGGTRTLDATTRTDWLSTGSGATIASVSPGAFSGNGAGPLQAIDQNPGTAWAGPGPETADDEGPRQLTIQLARAINVSAVTIDPGTDPRVGPSWAIREFRIETSTDGVAFTPAAGGAFTPADLGSPHRVALDAGTVPAVRYLRLVVLSTQGPFSDNSGAMAVAEISAYGTPWVAPAPSPSGGGGSTQAPQPVPEPGPSPEPPALTPAPVAPVRPPAPQATLRVAELPKLGALVRRGLPLRVTCATACRARVVVRLPFANGLVAGVAQRDLAAGRAATVRVKLRRGAAKRLAGRRSARARVTVQLTGREGGPARRLTQTIRLSR